MIPRYQEEALRTALNRYPAVGLIGSRQVGKTTLAKSLQGLLPKKIR
jgi:predicted AAA+ superfamily ATPase